MPVPNSVKDLRSRIGFNPPRGTPYFSARCLLKRVDSTRSGDRCDVCCRHLKAVAPIVYDCELGMLVMGAP